MGYLMPGGQKKKDKEAVETFVVAAPAAAGTVAEAACYLAVAAKERGNVALAGRIAAAAAVGLAQSAPTPTRGLRERLTPPMLLVGWFVRVRYRWVLAVPVACAFAKLTLLVEEGTFEPAEQQAEP
ncbi:hypothetical protein PG993_014000 [Apiospora rasikravindrae]|uniref:Uncharacterized protein n=1 Tax=Apiospora rasikravindrae TaxID=990691 RepID=A0ABR1RSY4_9PEZI